MEAKRENLNVVIEGMEVVIERDLKRHELILSQARKDYSKFREAVSYEIRKKRHYSELIRQGKYQRKAMETAINDINVNIRNMQDKAGLSEQKIKFEENIVETLTRQLEDQKKSLKLLNKN